MATLLHNQVVFRDHKAAARLPGQRFPLGRALVGLALVAMTGLAAGLVALGAV
jgi:hypothetical protein